MTAEEDIQKMIGKFERRMAKDEEAREKVKEAGPREGRMIPPRSSRGDSGPGESP